MSEDSELSVAEEQALLLAQAAIAMGDELARERRSLHGLVQALERNMQVWLGFKAIVSLDGCSLPPDARLNIERLADFVVGRTLQGAETIGEQTVQSFININLQISEGLLEGLAAVRERG